VFSAKGLALLAAAVVLLVLLGVGLGYALQLSPTAAKASVSLNGVPLDSGSQEVPPQPTLTVTLPGQASASDYRASIDGRAVDLESKAAGGAALRLPPMAQATWHKLDVWRTGLGGTRLQASEIDFRTTEPLQLAAAWLVGPDTARVDVSWSRPLLDAAPLDAALRQAGATVEHSDTAVIGKWSSAPTGAHLTFHLTAGFKSTTGSYLDQPFTPTVTVPAQRPYADVQLSEAVDGSTTGLKLQAYYVATPTGLADLAAHAHQISVLTPDFYGLGGDGHLYSSVDTAALRVAQQAGIEVQPLVTNLNFDGDKAHDVIAAPSGATAAADNLVAEARQRGYTGYQLDFENLHAADRDGFSRFSATLGQRMAAAGLKYSAAVIPRKGSASGGVLSVLPQSSGVYDYQALSKDSGWLSLMAYDQHTSGTSPGPVAGLDWVRQLLDGSSTGVDHGHLFLGVPLYYRDWTLGGDTSVGPYSEAVQIAVDYGAGVGWDFESGSAFIRYNRGAGDHVLWMDTRTSLAMKIATARERNFAGVSAWRLGFEDPAFWNLWPSR
jgi:spore germination protein YaaH